MPFSQVPRESKGQIKRAGQILAREPRESPAYRQALDLANRWRACHAYPINTFQATLRRKLKKHPQSAVVQRLKRMPTIIDKLRRYPAMQLTTMQDIGGVRAILKSIDNVVALTDEYRGSKRLKHDLVEVYDYISNPRDEDGYRSLHLVYKYRNKQAPSYDGLRLELQVRTRLQHIWATAVETMGTFLGQALKSRQGDREWLDFFATVSSAIACTEPVNNFETLWSIIYSAKSLFNPL